MPERMSSVYDIPDWLAEQFPSATGPARTAYNAALLPIDVGADLLRRGTHGALGLEESEPYKYSGERMKNIVGALGDTAEGVAAPARAVQGGMKNAIDYLREQLMASGARPQSTQPPPMNMAPGGTDAELRAGAPTSLRPTTMAAAPAARAPQPPVNLRPAGPMPPPVASAGPGPMPVAQAPQPAGALEGPAATPQRQSLMELFKQRMASLPAAEGQVSDQEKKQRKLEFFLNMLARNKGGSTFLQNAASAGLDTSAGVRSDREKAQAKAAAARTAGREDIFREIGFGDKDEDNRRGDLAEARKLELLKKQVAAGKMSVQKSAKGTYVIIDSLTGKTTDTGIKFAKDDKGNANIELIQYLEKLPVDQRERALKSLGRGQSDEEKDPYRVFKAATDRMTGDLSGDLTVEGAVGDARRALDLSRGKNSSDGMARPRSQQEFDALPKGTKFVNPKDGKVYTKK